VHAIGDWLSYLADTSNFFLLDLKTKRVLRACSQFLLQYLCFSEGKKNLVFSLHRLMAARTALPSPI
jgi:hypothetical protein